MSGSFRVNRRSRGSQRCIATACLCLLISVVVGLINHCAQNLVSEVVLLVPLLLRLRHPGADAGRLGPAVEEENWSGMEMVQFRQFRKNIGPYQDKRR